MASKQIKELPITELHKDFSLCSVQCPRYFLCHYVKMVVSFRISVLCKSLLLFSFECWS